jgi:hypothetical protein
MDTAASPTSTWTLASCLHGARLQLTQIKFDSDQADGDCHGPALCYASVEWLRYPQLKGLPVVIGGGARAAWTKPWRRARRADTALRFIPVEAFPVLRDYVGRGVITTATYAGAASSAWARPWG